MAAVAAVAAAAASAPASLAVVVADAIWATRSDGRRGACREERAGAPVNPAADVSLLAARTALPTAAMTPARRVTDEGGSGDGGCPPAGIGTLPAVPPPSSPILASPPAPSPPRSPLSCAIHPLPPRSLSTCATDAVTTTDETEPHRSRIASAARSARSRVARTGSSGQSRRAGASDWEGEEGKKRVGRGSGG